MQEQNDGADQSVAEECENEHTWQTGNRKEKLDFSSFSRLGGDSWTRTNDPIDVNDVL